VRQDSFSTFVETQGKMKDVALVLSPVVLQ
jgi:hypothetical protein